MNNLIQKLSHQHLPYKISVNQATVLLSIKYFQILALIQPQDMEINESSLLFASGILKTILIIPYAHNFTLIVLCLFILVLKNLLLVFCSILENSKPQIVSKLGIIYIYYDSIIIEQILALPELYLYMGLISYSNKKIAFESFKFEFVAPLCILMILVVSSIATIRCYFFRSSNIVTNTKVLPKFTYLILCRFTLQLVVVILCLDQSLNIVKFVIGILIFMISLLELHFETIFEPKINQSLILIVSSILLTTTVEFLCFLSFNKIEFKTVLIIILLFLPINITFFKLLIIRRQLNLLLNLHDYPLILVIEELYEFINKKKEDNMSHQDMIILYQIYNEHCKTCISCTKEHYNVFKLIQCLIVNKFKSDEKSKEKESLMIIYINFLCDKMMQPLIAYVELKKFEFKSKRFSLYYRFIRQDYNAKFKEKIEDKQAHMHLKSQSLIQQIEIKEIILSFHLEELYLQLYIKLLDQKIRVLNLQIKGVEQINEIKLAIMKYGKHLYNTIKKFKVDFKIIPGQEIESKNIIILKLMSILYSIILNDSDTATIIEDQILQICTAENSLPLDTICNASFVEDKVCLLSISMVKNRGKILNSNKKQLAKHFGYGHDDFHMINHINDLVPPFLVEVHDAILEQYLETAQSLLFKQFNMITTQQQGGLLQIKQLKLDNNFNFEDDYVITGCVARVKEGSEFIIFDQAGKILSSTEAIYHLMIQGIDQEDEMPIQTLSQCYIFFFFPEILKIFTAHKITNKSYHNLEIEDVATLVTRFNIIDFINQYQRALSTLLPHKRYQTENRGSQYFQKSKTSGLMTDSMSSISPIERVVKPKNDLQIFNITYQRQVEEAMTKLNEVGEAAYQVKFSLTFKRIGFEHLNKSYFIMEILDFRSKEQLLSKRRRISTTAPHHNYHPIQSSRFKQESFREDSKRMDQSSEQFIQSFALINQHHDLLMHENSSQKRYKSSQSEDVKSSQKSDSSQDSSQLNQNKECHTFIDSNNLIRPLKIIAFLTVIISILFIAFLIINLVIIEQNTNQIVQSNKNINAPLKFNRQFFQLFSLSWIQLLNRLDILSNSDFLLNQTQFKLQNISASTFQVLNNLYSSFIQFEQADLLGNLSFRHFDEDLQTVSYTYFILNLENAMKELLATQQNSQGTKIEITINYIDQMMNLRINLYNAFQMCKNLIISYDNLYQQTISVQTLKIEYLTIVMGIMMLIKLLPQYIYQLKCQLLQRQLIFMIGRVKERETRQQIQKFASIKEILENRENNYNWRQINYAQFGHRKSSESVSQRGSQQTTRMLNRQPIVLNTRIQNTQISKKPIILILTITYLTMVVFLSCGFVLYENEVSQMQPFSQMTTQFITFSTNFDALIGSGIVVKSVYTVFKKLVNTQVASQKEISKFSDPNMALFKLFLQSEANFDANLTSIFEQIIVSKQINDDDKSILENLYKYDICNYFDNDIPFCKYEQINSQFISEYSQPYTIDDIKIFYQNGIKGVTSQINQIIKQQYYYEIENQKLYEISPQDQVFLDSQQFGNGFLQHFLFTTKTIDVFLDIIQYSNEQYSKVNLQNIQIYYCLTGSVILIIYLIVYCKWIQINHYQMRYIKLGLSLLPQKAMNDPFVLNTIKQLR